MSLFNLIYKIHAEQDPMYFKCKFLRTFTAYTFPKQDFRNIQLIQIIKTYYILTIQKPYIVQRFGRHQF